MMIDREPQWRPALTLRPDQIPAFSAEDMRAFLQGAPYSHIGPTLSGEPPIMESLKFAGCKELTNRLHVSIGLADDALVCYAVLRGPFHARTIFLPPGSPAYFRVTQTVEEIYDASTGRLLVLSCGPCQRKPGY